MLTSPESSARQQPFIQRTPVLGQAYIPRQAISTASRDSFVTRNLGQELDSRRLTKESV